MFKFDDHQPAQTNVQQHMRKDSASSEVAALLSISGRTSRISSVGSQGSAISRLSAVSGVSRSPSPHRMLLETSFCGPKPVDSICDGSIISDESPAEILEQVLLARKHDPTQAVLAEGIHIDLDNSPKKKTTSAEIESTAKRKTLPKTPEVTITKPTARTTGTAAFQLRKTIGKKDVIKPIVGVTPSGTEYIRIKLKPDHMYEDNGLAENERVIDVPLEEVLKKPISLNLGKKPIDTTDSITKHPESSSKTSTPSTSNMKCASPKPARHIALTRDQGSRSPSPATVTVSRKSSFCSLFKSKDAIASPDSPRDRSRSKSRERTTSGNGDPSSTPNKQKSVLAIFKPARKLSGSKSKSTSPIDPESTSISHIEGGLSQVEFRFEPSQSCAIDNSRSSRSRERLRYYDTPLEGNVIHIPLHTPPEEKEIFKEKTSTSTSNRVVEFDNNTNKIEKFSEPSKPSIRSSPASDRPSTIVTPSRKEKLSRGYRIENPDGSIRIPLHSPTSNNESDGKEVESNWSIEVQRHSSQESQETVISTNNQQQNKSSSTPPIMNNALTSNSVQSNLSSASSGSVGKKKLDKITVTTKTIIPQNNTFDNTFNNNNTSPSVPPPTPASITSTRERKHILFSTRIGSGSEEQIFSTQFSLSKTESLSSQISEQATVLDSQSITTQLNDNQEKVQDSKFSDPISNIPEPVIEKANEVLANANSEVVLRQKKPTLQEELSSAVEHYQDKIAKDDFFNANRHSRYIENIDEIMEAQKKLTASLARHKREGGDKNSDEESPDIEKPPTKDVHIKSNSKDKITSLEIHTTKNNVSAQPPASSDYQGSSESEKDSENESSVSSTRIKRHHIPRNLGVVDDHESTGLVSQQSFEEDLPYVPTTLPEERTRGISLIPAKERVHMEIKTCSVERPRSTTPINPASLEEYCGTIQTDDNDNVQLRGDKLKISLPRRNSKDRDVKVTSSGTAKSPRRISASSQKTWFEFAAEQINTPSHKATPNPQVVDDDQPPPPLPPRKPITQPAPGSSQTWINFEDIPEKKKMPKKITTLPLKEPPIQYSYVNPEDCQCECHENERLISSALQNETTNEVDQNKIAQLKLQQQQQPNPPEDVQPLLEPDHSDCVDRTR